MTAPTINGNRYPQPVEALLPQARKLTKTLGDMPSRNRLMREFRIGAAKADDLLARLRTEQTRQARTDAMRDHLLSRGSLVDRVELFRVPDETDDDRTDVPAMSPMALGPDPAPAPAEPGPVPATEAAPTGAPDVPPVKASPQPAGIRHPGTNITTGPVAKVPAARRPVRSWPVLLLALPAFVAIWSGWVGLGGLTGFGVVHPLPGIWSDLSVDTAITLPIGVETYAAYALRAWLSGLVPPRALRFAKWSAIGSLLLGALGQVAYHLMESAGMTAAPWWITTLVASLPVLVLGMGAALAHLMHDNEPS